MREEANVSDLEHADDMALVNDDLVDTLEEVLKMLNRVCVGMGLSINEGKTLSWYFILYVLKVCPLD